MDLAAKERWANTHLLDRPTPASLSAFDGWHVLYYQRKLSQFQVELIYEAIHTPANSEEYWATRKIIQPSTK
jgi:hypothetical protein